MPSDIPPGYPGGFCGVFFGGGGIVSDWGRTCCASGARNFFGWGGVASFRGGGGRLPP